MRLYLQYGVLLLQLLAALTLLRRRLGAAHSGLVAYLIFTACMNAFLANVDGRSADYLRIWAFALPVGTALSVTMGLQAYGRSLETLPRVRLLSHFVLLALCLLAALLAQFAQDTVTPYGVLSRVDQGVSAALGLFCLLMLPMLEAYYSPRRRPNARAQEWILTLHYVGNALVLLATHWKLAPFHLYLFTAVSVICCGAWTLCLTQQGEALPPPPAGGPENPLLEKLAAEAQFDALTNKAKSAARSN